MECDGNKKVDGYGNKGGRQAAGMAKKRVMVTVTRVTGNKKAMATAADGNEGGR